MRYAILTVTTVFLLVPFLVATNPAAACGFAAPCGGPSPGPGNPGHPGGHSVGHTPAPGTVKVVQVGLVVTITTISQVTQTIPVLHIVTRYEPPDPCITSCRKAGRGSTPGQESNNPLFYGLLGTGASDVALAVVLIMLAVTQDGQQDLQDAMSEGQALAQGKASLRNLQDSANQAIGSEGSGNSQTNLLQATQNMQETQMAYNLQYLGFQEQMQSANQNYTVMSNIMKKLSDTKQAIIENLKG